MMLFCLWVFVLFFTTNFALELNFYTSVGQVKEVIPVRNGYFQTCFSNQEYNSIVPGTIDFPGQQLVEQDLYNSNEELRNAHIYVRSNKHGRNKASEAKLIDPYSFLVQHSSSRYGYVTRENIEFNQDPRMDGMTLSVRLENTTIKSTTITYLTRGLSWTPRYDVVVNNEQSATIRALADINNDHPRIYKITDGYLITGTIPLALNSVRAPVSADSQRIEYMASPLSTGGSASVSTVPESTNFGSYSYHLKREFNLLPKSVKTFPFLSTKIGFNYTLETVTYLSAGSNAGLFQRTFLIKPSEFLPAGTITFYVATSGITLGQGRLPDSLKDNEQKISVGPDPDVKYRIISILTATRQAPNYGQDLDVNIIISNRKESQSVSVGLTINSGFRNTTLIIKDQTSNISIKQDPNNGGMLIIQANIQPNQEESCMLFVQQFN